MFWIAVIRVQDYSKTVLHVRLCREEIFHGILGSFTEIIEFLFVLWHIFRQDESYRLYIFKQNICSHKILRNTIPFLIQ